MVNSRAGHWSTVAAGILAWLFLHLATCQTSEKNFIDQMFQGNDLNTLEAIKCSKLEGSADTCLACYTCDDNTITQRRKVSNIYNLVLRDRNCTSNRVCCIEANFLVARNTDNCGKHNPEGNPRRRRPSLRSVLEMEFPWRAWVYSMDSEAPLCAATYMNMGTNALVTTASCVKDRQPTTLYVKFTKTQRRPDRVLTVIVHENYQQRKDGSDNDIAVLTLMKKPETRVLPACLPSPTPNRFGGSCVIVSSSETYINTIMPQQKRCKSKESMADFGGKVMCSFSMKGDYTPQHGAGLYCLDEQASKPTYSLQGIYQENQNNDRMFVYTNVTAYVSWLHKCTSKSRSL